MAGRGFQEAQAAYTPSVSVAFVGQVRRFGPHGPAYEVLGMASSTTADIVVIESGERLTYAVADLIADPIAETVP